MTVKITLTAVTDGFERAIIDAIDKLRELQQVAMNAVKSVDNFGTAVGRIGVKLTASLSAALTAVSGAAVLFANNFTSAADVLANAATEAGLTGEAYQELSHAIGVVADVSADAARGGLQRMSLTIGKAIDGADNAVGTMEELGVSIEDLASGAVNNEQFLDILIDRLRNVGTSAEAARLASEVFGETVGVKLGTAVHSSATSIDELRQQFRDLGLGISEGTLEASGEFQDNMELIRVRVGAASNAIAAALIPALNELIPIIVDQVIPIIVGMGQAVGDAIQWFTTLPEPVQTATAVIATALGAGGPVLIALGVLSKAFAALVVATGPIGLFIAAATAAYAAWQVWGEDITVLVSSVTSTLTETFTNFTDFMNELWTGLASLIDNTFGAAMIRVKDLTDGVVNGIAEAWQWLSDTLVGNSIVPDMLSDIEGRFGQHSSVVGSMTDDTTNHVAASYDRSAQKVKTSLSSMSGEAMGLLGQLFKGSKEIAIAQAIVNAYEGITKTLATYPWPYAGIMAALHAAVAFKQVAALKSTNPGSSNGSGMAGGKSSGASAAAAPMTAVPSQSPSIVSIQGINEGDLYSGSRLLSLFEALNEGAKAGYRVQFVQ